MSPTAPEDRRRFLSSPSDRFPGADNDPDAPRPEGRSIPQSEPSRRRPHTESLESLSGAERTTAESLGIAYTCVYQYKLLIVAHPQGGPSPPVSERRSLMRDGTAAPGSRLGLTTSPHPPATTHHHVMSLIRHKPAARGAAGLPGGSRAARPQDPTQAPPLAPCASEWELKNTERVVRW